MLVQQKLLECTNVAFHSPTLYTGSEDRIGRLGVWQCKWLCMIKSRLESDCKTFSTTLGL